ncbi:hypothetical protein JCM10908_005100 [Rhodotorula pacifica]|uniref:WW domain-containing protein n=1 Tax=Rhodotorula pacifica TaxID=1495444 RepID=UPI00316BFE97
MSASPSPSISVAGDARPLPPGWISEIDPTSGVPYFVDTTQPNPQATWEDPRPAYYANLAKSNVHAPPAGPPPPSTPAYNPSPASASPNLGPAQMQGQYYPAQGAQQQPQPQQQQQEYQNQQYQQQQQVAQSQPAQATAPSSSSPSTSKSSGPNPMVASAAAGFGGAMLGGMVANSLGRSRYRAPPVIVAPPPVRRAPVVVAAPVRTVVTPGDGLLGGPRRSSVGRRR